MIPLYQKSIQQTIHDIALQEQDSSILNSSKLDFYKNIYKIQTRAQYVDSKGYRSDRPVLAKIRISAHNLTVEKGRYTGIPRSDQPGRVAQSVTCLATDACLTANPGVASSIQARSHTFVEIDHEIISTVILLLLLICSRRVVVSYKRKSVHELLVNRLFKPAQEKSVVR